MSGLTPPWFVESFVDSSGNPLAGAKMYFFIAGSTVIPKNVYSDLAQSIVLTQPLVCDASGTAPQYFMESGFYKIVVTSATGNIGSPVRSRDNVTGVGNSSVGTPGTVLSTAGDSTAGYLADKLENSPSITWTLDNIGGYIKMVGTVNPTGILNYLVKTNASDPSPDYLINKMENTATVVFSLDAGTNKVKADLAQAYLLLSGGSVSGAVTFSSPVTVNSGLTMFNGYVTNDLAVGDAITAHMITTDIGQIGFLGTNSFRLNTVTQAGVLQSDSSGNVSVVPGLPFQVKTSVTDLIPGYLATKIVPGTGITFNTTTDGVNGEVIHVSTQTPDYNGVLVLGKQFPTATSTTVTPVSVLTAPLGSFTIPGGMTKVGTQYRMTLKFPQTTAAFLLDISLSADTGGGVIPNIPMPAGSSQIDFDVLFEDISYGANSSYSYTITSATAPYFTMSTPGGWGIFDCAADQTFDAKVHAASISSMVPNVNLWKM